MAGYNKVILIGRVATEPEMRYTTTGKPVVNFVIAVDRARTQGEKQTDFINIVAWQKLAEICANYLNKGKLISVDGRLQTRSYQTPEGQKRKVYEVVAQGMQMLDRSKQEASPSAEKVNQNESVKEDTSFDESQNLSADTEDIFTEDVPF